MKNKTTFLSRESCYISDSSKIGNNCIIYPSVVIIDSVIGDNVTIQTGTIIKDKSIIKNNCLIGPSVLIRNESIIEENSTIGHGSEIKNSIVGSNSIIAHKNFIGDSIVGKNVNFGFGSCTANYDFNQINKTIIGDNVKIGCNTVLVAPCTIGNNSIIGACSKVKGVVEENSLFKVDFNIKIKELRKD